VLIATPHDTHEHLVAAALDAGKAVLLEKPLSSDLDSAVRIAASARHASPPTGVLFPLRYDDRFLAAREAIERGYLGDPLAGLSTYLSDKAPSYFFGGFSGRAPSTWRTSKARSGGGVLIMNLVHHVDVIRALLGEAATSVVAEFVPGRLAPEIDDVACLVARFGAAVVTFVGGASVVQGPGQSIRLWGTAGQLTVIPEMSVSSRLGGSPTVPVVAQRADDSLTRTRAIEAFAGAVTRGTRPEVTVDDALDVQALVAAAYAAAETRTAVSPAELLRAAGV
jgi:predicted dehydrogenase